VSARVIRLHVNAVPLRGTYRRSLGASPRERECFEL